MASDIRDFWTGTFTKLVDTPPPRRRLRAATRPAKRPPPFAGGRQAEAAIRRTPVISLPASRMRATASAIGSIATAMWKALA
jgi:hypothetical protein